MYHGFSSREHGLKTRDTNPFTPRRRAVRSSPACDVSRFARGPWPRPSAGTRGDDRLDVSLVDEPGDLRELLGVGLHEDADRANGCFTAKRRRIADDRDEDAAAFLQDLERFGCRLPADGVEH